MIKMNKNDNAEIAIIGGTGIYDLEGIQDEKIIDIPTPFGHPSGLLKSGYFKNRKIVFMPRHGKKHSVPPHKINFRANIWIMKKLGVGLQLTNQEKQDLVAFLKTLTDTDFISSK